MKSILNRFNPNNKHNNRVQGHLSRTKYRTNRLTENSISAFLTLVILGIGGVSLYCGTRPSLLNKNNFKTVKMTHRVIHHKSIKHHHSHKIHTIHKSLNNNNDATKYNNSDFDQNNNKQEPIAKTTTKNFSNNSSNIHNNSIKSNKKPNNSLHHLGNENNQPKSNGFSSHINRTITDNSGYSGNHISPHMAPSKINK